MKVFYSWQADTPPRIGKQFVRQALDDAVEQLAVELELDEAERPTVEQDTQGVLGSPPIAETIFEKIRESQVVVADVTLTCATPEDKKLINSNVAYELGYAHGHHGHEVILKVMNTNYGPADDLPFDLQHRRWPVRYDLRPNAKKKELRDVRAALTKELVAILRQYAEGKITSDNHEPIPLTVNAASYWREGETIVRARRFWDVSDDTDVELCYFKDDPLCYLRIWPDTPIAGLSGEQMRDYNVSIIEPLFRPLGGHSHDRNRYGMISYTGSREIEELSATTQVFRNGEVWGVNAHCLRPPRSEKFEEIDFLPCGTFEKGMMRSLGEYLKRAFDKFGYPNIVHIEAGLVNINGYRLGGGDMFEPFKGRFFDDLVINATIDKSEPKTIEAALLKIFETVWDEAGEKRPPHNNDFPPISQDGSR